MKQRDNINPWHGLPLYYADHDPHEAAKGLAVLQVLAHEKNPAEDNLQEKLWAAYYQARGQADAAVPAVDFAPGEAWLPAAAASAQALPGGAVLAHTLKKLAEPKKLPSKILEAYCPEVARQQDKTKTLLALAVKAIACWHKGWHSKPAAAQPSCALQRLVWQLRWLEPYDFSHLPPNKLKHIKELHLALVLSLNAPALALREGLPEAVDGVQGVLKPFQLGRHNGLGEPASRAGFTQPHGYGQKPQGVFRKLMAENVWLRSLPVYWRGRLLTADEQELLAQARRESKVASTLEAAMDLSAFQDAPSSSGFQRGGVTRKTILDAIIQDSTQEF